MDIWLFLLGIVSDGVPCVLNPITPDLIFLGNIIFFFLEYAGELRIIVLIEEKGVIQRPKHTHTHTNTTPTHLHLLIGTNHLCLRRKP
jgi:hypothetical protein